MITQKVIRLLINGDVTLCEGYVFDFLTIQWDNINLSQHDLDLWLPSNPFSVLDIKINFEEIIEKSQYPIQNYCLLSLK